MLMETTRKMNRNQCKKHKLTGVSEPNIPETHFEKLKNLQ